MLISTRNKDYELYQHIQYALYVNMYIKYKYIYICIRTYPYTIVYIYYIGWRPANDPKIDRLECVKKKAVKWILNEQYHHYNEWEYTCRLRDLDLLPIKYIFILNDLIIFHKIFHDCYFIKLPLYFRPNNDDDRGRIRSLVAPPDYYNSQRTTVDLGSMRAVSYDAKLLKCTLSTVTPSFKRSFFSTVSIYYGITFL